MYPNVSMAEPSAVLSWKLDREAASINRPKFVSPESPSSRVIDGESKWARISAERQSMNRPLKKKPGFLSSSGRRTSILSISSEGHWLNKKGNLCSAWSKLEISQGIHLNKASSLGFVGLERGPWTRSRSQQATSWGNAATQWVNFDLVDLIFFFSNWASAWINQTSRELVQNEGNFTEIVVKGICTLDHIILRFPGISVIATQCWK